jgi:hypothetical protein
MCINYESLVIYSEIFFSGNFYLDHLELLLSCSSANIDIIVSILNVEYNEFS